VGVMSDINRTNRKNLIAIWAYVKELLSRKDPKESQITNIEACFLPNLAFGCFLGCFVWFHIPAWKVPCVVIGPVLQKQPILSIEDHNQDSD